jgi:hypothetical protein
MLSPYTRVIKGAEAAPDPENDPLAALAQAVEAAPPMPRKGLRVRKAAPAEGEDAPM